ncbi:hypothetical protein ABZ649_04810 [Streptomyces albidoflavus]|uniref:hypothetical protein n=1 Tax=Streptomyces albidoflavus TaxID=1886 RepID=UPI0033E73D77
MIDFGPLRENDAFNNVLSTAPEAPWHDIAHDVAAAFLSTAPFGTSLHAILDNVPDWIVEAATRIALKARSASRTDASIEATTAHLAFQALTRLYQGTD